MARDKRLAAAAEELKRLAVPGAARAASVPLPHNGRRANGIDCRALIRPQLVVDFDSFERSLLLIRPLLRGEPVVHELAARVEHVLAQVHLERARRVDVPRRPQAPVRNVEEGADVVRADVALAAELGLPRVVRAVCVL